MNIWGVILILTGLALGTAVFIWYMLKPRSASPKTAAKNAATGGASNSTQQLFDQSERTVQAIFNDEFREELRNRGRLHFEKIIGENAMFLQQDLRLTTSQLNEYMKNEITQKLQEEFAKYEKSIMDAKQLAIDSIGKTQEAIEQQRQMMSQQLAQEIKTERVRLIKRFEENLADIVNHYVLAAIGNQIDLNDQLEYILAELETNKVSIIRDITDGA